MEQVQYRQVLTPSKWCLAAVLLFVLPLTVIGVWAEDDEQSTDPLVQKMDAVYQGIFANPEEAWLELEKLEAESSQSEDRELWADWNIIAAIAKQSLGEMDESERYLAVSLSTYREVGSVEGELDAILIRADIYSTLGRYTESIEEFNAVIEGSKKLEGTGDDDPRYFTAAAHNGLGDAYTVIGDSAAALEHVLKAYELYSALGDDEAISGTFVLMGNIYGDLGAPEKALESYQGALQLDRQRGDEYNVSTNLYNMARAYTRQGNHQEAYRYYDEAMEIAERVGLTVNSGYVHYGRGLSLFDEGLMDEARESFSKAAEVLESVSDHYMLARSHLHLARVASRQGEHEASNQLLNQALGPFERTDSGRDLVDIHASYAENYAALGQYQMAYEHESTRSELMKELSSEEQAGRTAQLRVRFESEKAEAENRALSADNELKQESLEREQFHNRIILGGVLVLLLVALALSYSIWRQKQLEKKLKMLANTDDLTGLLNRRHLFELGTTEMVRAIRYDQRLSLLVLDLDYFKEINDRYGHATGDSVLKRVTAFLADEMRDTDILGRVGGEEFVAVLPHTSRERASEAAKRLSEGLAALDLFDCCKVDNPVTMSIGVAWLQGQGDTFQMIINRADAALYEAKAAGRNTVKLQSDAPSNVTV